MVSVPAAGWPDGPASLTLTGSVTSIVASVSAERAIFSFPDGVSQACGTLSNQEGRVERFNLTGLPVTSPADPAATVVAQLDGWQSSLLGSPQSSETGFAGTDQALSVARGRLDAAREAFGSATPETRARMALVLVTNQALMSSDLAGLPGTRQQPLMSECSNLRSRDLVFDCVAHGLERRLLALAMFSALVNLNVEPATRLLLQAGVAVAAKLTLDWMMAALNLPSVLDDFGLSDGSMQVLINSASTQAQLTGHYATVDEALDGSPPRLSLARRTLQALRAALNATFLGLVSVPSTFTAKVEEQVGGALLSLRDASGVVAGAIFAVSLDPQGGVAVDVTGTPTADTLAAVTVVYDNPGVSHFERQVNLYFVGQRPDAGADAGVPDAGAHDAGPAPIRDAGSILDTIGVWHAYATGWGPLPNTAYPSFDPRSCGGAIGQPGTELCAVFTSSVLTLNANFTGSYEESGYITQRDGGVQYFHNTSGSDYGFMCGSCGPQTPGCSGSCYSRTTEGESYTIGLGTPALNFRGSGDIFRALDGGDWILEIPSYRQDNALMLYSR
jgi:hypothetical protein